MNKKFMDLLKIKNYVVPSYLFTNYSLLGVSDKELIILIYLINKEQPLICDYKKISEEMNIDKKDVMTCISDLKNKGLLEIKLDKNSESKLEEYIFLDSLFSKIFINFIDNEDKNEKSNVYSLFEKELGRIMSPIEYELISGWISNGYSEELILEALKEAVFSGVTNFRYIDKILFEWSKKGIKDKDQVMNSKKEYKTKKEENVDVPDYDWLNNNE